MTPDAVESAAPEVPVSPEARAWTEEQLRRGRDLVASLTDQYAAGQVEALYGLHTAAAAARREAEQVTTLLTSLRETREELEQTIERVSARVATSVSAQLRGQLHSALHELVAEQVQPIAAHVLDSAAQAGLIVAESGTQAAAALAELSQGLELRLREISDRVLSDLSQRADETLDRIEAASRHAQQVSEAAASAVTTEVDFAAELLQTAGTALETHISAAAQAGARQLAEASDHLVTTSAETIDGVDFVGARLTDALGGLTGSFLTDLERVLTTHRRSEAKVETDREARVHKLVERTDDALDRALERLQRETDWLATRDERQERLRSDAFVAALETLLDQSSGRLRGRVREVIGLERRRRDSADAGQRGAADQGRPDLPASARAGQAEPAAPLSLPAAPDGPTTEAGPRKATPVRATPTKATPTKATPTKAAPRKASGTKAAPRKASASASKPAPRKTAAPSSTSSRPRASQPKNNKEKS